LLARRLKTRGPFFIRSHAPVEPKLTFFGGEGTL
jgi:hypothetical protein